ncbi:bis(5'-nucleosyl)-tetraphosphatase [Anaeroplasma bactoclasticum]|jgi:8-oxo-dGTP pyrophosphatase MutT (NUDIX family)|nr:NUDIX domain-containing protein [Anaeroplasma bactoclasticum]
MEREKSCGAVLYLMKEGKRFYLIEKMRLGHYSLVKGHVEGNETEEETALREIKEETNLDAKLDTSFRQVITYSPKVGVIKDVVFFVGEIVSLDVKAQEEEVNQILFLEFEDAINTLTYESDKEILRLARRHLK